MTIAIMAESRPGERRVALVPEAARFYARRGLGLRLEAGAGVRASFPDGEYEDAGVAVVPGRDALLAEAGVVLKVQPPTLEEVAALAPGSILVCHLDPLGPTEVIEALAERGVTAFAVELIPRITRAQKMDVLSSQATVAGYKAVLSGAGAMTRFLPMLTTAAGTVRPAKAMILGAGVAGLQAIATARRLGAVVSAFDIRPAVKEQVQSLAPPSSRPRSTRAPRTRAATPRSCPRSSTSANWSSSQPTSGTRTWSSPRRRSRAGPPPSSSRRRWSGPCGPAA